MWVGVERDFSVVVGWDRVVVSKFSVLLGYCFLGSLVRENRCFCFLFVPIDVSSLGASLASFQDK